MKVFKRYLVMFLLAVACFLIQSTILPLIKLGAVMPNFLVILTAGYGYIRGGREGVFTGFFCGLLCDIFFGNTMGIYALIYVILGYLNYSVHKRLGETGNPRTPLLYIMGTDLLYGLISYFCFYMLRGNFAFGYCLGNIIIPEAIYTGLFAMPIYILIRSIEHKSDRTQSKTTSRFI